jgi:YVTN family beta-propeller protein
MYIVLSLLATVYLAAPIANSDPTFHVIKRILVGGEGGWDYLTVDSASHRLYLSRGTHVMVVNLQSDKVEGDIPNTPGVHGIAIVADQGRGFISNGGDSTVTVFDLKTLKETARVKVGSRPDAIIYDPASKRVFTFNAGTSDSTAIDAATGTIAGSVPLGGKPEAAAADGKGTVFVNVEDKNEVIAFDSKTLAVKHHWPLAPGEEPTGLALDQKHHRLFSACHNKKLVVLDSESGKVIATPEIGDGTDGAAFDEKESLAFSSNGDGTLTIVKEQSPEKFAVLETVKTEPGARTIALDSKTHQVYLVTAKLQPPPPGTDPNARQRRSYEPGSFVVLVIGKKPQ